MGLRREERQIGRARYQVTQLGFRDARAVLLRAGRVIAPAFGDLPAGTKVEQALDVDLATIGRAFAKLFDKLTESELDFFVDTFSRTTMVQVESGSKWVRLADVAELHFAGPEGIRDCLGWLRFCFELNFGPFSIGSGRDEGGPPETHAR